jgi:hypothetical protein
MTSVGLCEWSIEGGQGLHGIAGGVAVRVSRSWMMLMLVVQGCGGVEPGGLSAGGGAPGAGGGGGGGGVGSVTDGGSCVDTWASFGESFFVGECAGCHGVLGSHAGVQANAGSIQGVISSGAMPRGASVSAPDRARAVSYLRCGAP